MESRPDFRQILRTKFKLVHNIPWLPDFLLESVAYLGERLTRYKGQMLDHKQHSVKQVFKLFNRVEHLLHGVTNLEDQEPAFLSSEVSKSILADIADLFVTHIYDHEIKASLLHSLVAEAFN